MTLFTPEYWEEKARLKQLQEARERQQREDELRNKQLRVLTYWENQKKIIEKSLSRTNNPLRGCYTENGLISQYVLDRYNAFISNPNKDTWRTIATINILPNKTFHQAWQEADNSVTSEIDINDTLSLRYPEPETLNKGISLLVQQREIEIESTVFGLSTGRTNQFVTPS
jgi:hypothetical protein